MKIGIQKTVEVEAKTIEIYAKVSDLGSYIVCDQHGEEVGERDGYVPDWFPGDHYGDYLIFKVDLETGRITNWNVPTAEQLQEMFD